ncbi:bifunctional cobalt-precorrin-7 (C(5))-methyltransferase/cobalt-precorrin-6B (C(15))-methyltransferase [Methanoregula sp. UBA64]|jgi:cobalt-precorrin-6B (C15)-methyltransferase|uniref:bifunctional cobalt-precorrin-7 (C(5))-methyltransferase/cobalt-precorrin-6B (C(15))-methyltransferase n=1 Tax=Methanoregula sp. UBA64 TaxID=1915554 RepID=UPI0025DEB47F|nr:methyltransferase domain-containing protein [Methanoregula sp. UBA64]
MGEKALAGGPTQDEIMAVSLFKLGIRPGDLVFDIGCGTGKVAIAMAGRAKKVWAIDRRPEAIACATAAAEKAGVTNIEFFCGEAADFLPTAPAADCAFVGGSREIESFLPALARTVKRTIVVNAVLVSTLATVTDAMQTLGIFSGAVQVQVSRSHPLGKSFMFVPIDPVYIIVGRGTACS